MKTWPNITTHIKCRYFNFKLGNLTLWYSQFIFVSSICVSYIYICISMIHIYMWVYIPVYRSYVYIYTCVCVCMYVCIQHKVTYVGRYKITQKPFLLKNLERLSCWQLDTTYDENCPLLSHFSISFPPVFLIYLHDLFCSYKKHKSKKVHDSFCPAYIWIRLRL